MGENTVVAGFGNGSTGRFVWPTHCFRTCVLRPKTKREALQEPCGEDGHEPQTPSRWVLQGMDTPNVQINENELKMHHDWWGGGGMQRLLPEAPHYMQKHFPGFN